jgi:uncharacterized membrane protein
VRVRLEADLPVSATARVLIATLVGVATGAVLAFGEPWQLSVLAAFDSAELVFLVLVWSSIRQLDGQETQRVALSEDDSVRLTSLVVLVACTTALVAQVLGLVKARETSGAMTAAITTVAVLGVALAWLTVHSIYTLHYARLYYSGTHGGIEFPEEDEPDYRDFAYVAFTVGMTFQVSDTNISDRQIRRTITRQSLLSYLFGTVIIGTMINVMAGLIR